MNLSRSTSLRSQFLLDPSVTFLNHGSFGATPRAVFRAYQRYQLALEREPVEFLGRRADALLAKARADLANFIGAAPNDLVFVTNATTGVNIVAHSLALQPGDEVLATDHEYGAIDRTWRFYAQKAGFRYLNQPIPLPVTTPEAWLEQFWRGVTPRTRVISISHITSPTALTWPLEEVCQRAHAQGILTVIDGAHAPGQIPIDMARIGADFYTGNLHKWLCAPKGAAFLYAQPAVQALIEPLVVSWGYQSERPGPSTFIDYNQWLGTRDISAFLAVSDALAYRASRPWDAIAQRCHQLAIECAARISALSGQTPLAPLDGTWFAQMVTAPLPPGTDPARLGHFLWEERRIEVPLISWRGQPFIRVSFQAYNDAQDLETLCTALEDYYREDRTR
jgi:isopenicillin-N epimerase